MIEIKSVSKSFTKPNGGRVSILKQFSLNIKKGEIVTLFGPNGCGKSTLLSLLSGSVEPDRGKVILPWSEEAKGNIGFVFQNYGDVLHPWRTVRENLELPLEIHGGSTKEQREEQALQCLKNFGLDEHADKYVYQLSGGQHQLVTICQATVYNPELLLCDEPFSALDYTISRRLWLQLRNFLVKHDMSTMFVSHAIDEAIFLGDRVCVLSPRPGKILKDIKIPFGKERTLDMVNTPEFFAIRKEILSTFEEGRKKSA